MDGEHLVIGTGIYLAPSIIDHSCAPNAVAIFDGPILTIRTITDVQDFHWDKVCQFFCSTFVICYPLFIFKKINGAIGR